MTAQIPGGRIAENYGTKPTFGIAVLINGILSLCIPFSSRAHWVLLFVIRAMQGLAQVRRNNKTDKNTQRNENKEMFVEEESNAV